jgi:hypothetical protein
MSRPRIKEVTKVASSNKVKAYRLKHSEFQLKRVVIKSMFSHDIKIVS